MKPMTIGKIFAMGGHEGIFPKIYQGGQKW